MDDDETVRQRDHIEGDYLYQAGQGDGPHEVDQQNAEYRSSWIGLR